MNFAAKVSSVLGRASVYRSHFSLGLTVTMPEGQSVAPIIRAYLGDANRDKLDPFADHQLFCEMGIDVLGDVLDSFWEHPLSFAHCVYSGYTEYITDMFAGRFYAHERARVKTKRTPGYGPLAITIIKR